MSPGLEIMLLCIKCKQLAHNCGCMVDGVNFMAAI